MELRVKTNVIQSRSAVTGASSESAQEVTISVTFWQLDLILYICSQKDFRYVRGLPGQY